jgi:hypothetical protein
MGSTPSKVQHRARAGVEQGKGAARASTTTTTASTAAAATLSAHTGHALPLVWPEKQHALREAVRLYRCDEEENLYDVDGVVGWVDRSAGPPSVAAAVLRKSLLAKATSTPEGRMAVPFDTLCEAMFALSSEASAATKARFIFRVMCGGGTSGNSQSGSGSGGVVQEEQLADFMQCVAPWLTPAAAATVAASAVSNTRGGLTERDVVQAIGEEELVERLTVDVV